MHGVRRPGAWGACGGRSWGCAGAAEPTRLQAGGSCPARIQEETSHPPPGEEGKTCFCFSESPAHCRPEQRGRKGGALPLTVCDFLGMGAGGCRAAALDSAPRASGPESSTPAGPERSNVTGCLRRDQGAANDDCNHLATPKGRFPEISGSLEGKAPQRPKCL